MSLTAIEKTQAVVDLMETNLPALFAAYLPTALDNLDEYQNFSPQDDKKKICAVYIDAEDDNTDVEIFNILIQIQLYGKDQVQEYHSVIMPFLRQFLTHTVVEMEERKHIKADTWPMDVNGSSFIYYSVSFENSLDGCDF